MTPDALTDSARTDGGPITVATLRDLRAQALRPSPPPAPLPAVPPAGPPLLIARPSLADNQARAAARGWIAARAGQRRVADPGDEALLHVVETSALGRPPVETVARAIDADLAELYLLLAGHWLTLAQGAADRRYLNAALKLLGVCLVAPLPATELAADTLARSLEALDTLTVHSPWPSGRPLPVVETATNAPATMLEPRIAVLAGADSRGLPQFLDAARNLPIAGVVLHDAGQRAEPPSSAYASAWYPASDSTRPRPVPEPSTVPHQRAAHRDWLTIAAHLADWRTDLLVLIGMDVVPSTILAVPHLGTINAHNGALPGYRGMDAVAWAVLAGDPVVCSVHHVTEDVDAGHVLTAREVPTGVPGLRQSVKDTQLELLTDVCLHVAATGFLPAGQPQTGTPRRHYRMHPALRQRLDTAPRPNGAAA
ncbi:formyltransferase family protein [Kitasatospora brasiliensis]|uniref:formyltransferase family protein n=1 Tax=Kitasatospora brasiliensis TaxID=3058040 RepID=UPI00292E0660|nr:formyltransferase family protein [Kitasatospora sp. K002]